MLSQILSWVLMALGLAAFWWAPKFAWGWFIGITQQALYIFYGILTRQYGFIAHGIAFSIVFGRNYMMKRRKEKKKAAKKAAKKAKHEVATAR